MITLYNPSLLVNVLPERGARIDDIVDRTTGRNWLWHKDDYRVEDARPLPLATSFDEHWQGGWEEMFPNDATTNFEGHDLVDHGELWSQPWQLQYSDGRTSVILGLSCKTVAIDVIKAITIDAWRPQFEIAYRFTNRSDDWVHAQFKLHPALRIEEGDEILMPDCLIEPVDLNFSTIIGEHKLTPFPEVRDKSQQVQSINTIRAFNGHDREFVYASKLSQGWCALRHAATGSTLRLEFDRLQFPYVWIFQSYGGFLGQYVAMLEPATSMPWDIHVAHERKTTMALPPHSTQQMRVRAWISV